MESNERNQRSERIIRVFYAMVTLVFGGLLAYFVYLNTFGSAPAFPFKFGLDLAGGSHLVYEADISGADPADVPELMEVLRDVIERRINVFGVSEPIVQVEQSSIVSGTESHRLIVELPGVTDVNQAINEIGKTPLLEFKLTNEEALSAAEMAQSLAKNASSSGAGVSNVKINGEEVASDPFVETGLTGRYLKSAQLQFTGQNNQAGLSNEPIVSIEFNEEGATLFEEITGTHRGELLAIFLDGEMISAPRINEQISGGRAIISGGFTPTEAKALAENLNFGALPVPITLASTQTIGSSLGDEALHAGIYAGMVGFILLCLFMILWYRVPGVVAVIGLTLYVLMMLALFQFIPVVLTTAGIAGFILSVGLAVDANVLIAERIKEELRDGKEVPEAIVEGFARAWLAIRDSNIAHIIAGAILFWFGTSLIKGFALVFAIGVIVSMFSAITISRTLLLALPLRASSRIGKFLMSSGVTRF